MKNLRLSPLFLIIIVVTSTPFFYVCSSASLTITVFTDKPVYLIDESITTYGNLTYNVTPVQNWSVALEVQDPNKTPVVTRTLETDTNGRYNLTFKLPTSAELGSYTAYVSSHYKGETATANVTFELLHASESGRGPETDVLRFKVVKAPPPPPNETLYVNEFTADYVDWTTHGDSPYLDAIEDGNHIEGTTAASWMAWFGFENFTLGDAEIKEVLLEGYTNGSYNEAVDYDIYAEEGFTWIGSLYAIGEPAWVTPRWIGQTVDEACPAVLTEEGLNNLQVMVEFYDPDGYGGAGNIIDCLRLKVWYEEPTDAYTQRLREMQNCTIDALTRLIRPSDIETLESECYTVTSTPGFHMGHIGFNIRPDHSYRPGITDGLLRGKIMSDVWFRFALFKCYDQDNIIAS